MTNPSAGAVRAQSKARCYVSRAPFFVSPASHPASSGPTSFGFLPAPNSVAGPLRLPAVDPYLSASSPRLVLLPFLASCFSFYNAPAISALPFPRPLLDHGSPFDDSHPFIARLSATFGSLVHLTSPYPRRPHAQCTTPHSSLRLRTFHTSTLRPFCLAPLQNTLPNPAALPPRTPVSASHAPPIPAFPFASSLLPFLQRSSPSICAAVSPTTAPLSTRFHYSLSYIVLSSLPIVRVPCSQSLSPESFSAFPFTNLHADFSPAPEKPKGNIVVQRSVRGALLNHDPFAEFCISSPLPMSSDFRNSAPDLHLTDLSPRSRIACDLKPETRVQASAHKDASIVGSNENDLHRCLW
ncbi:hypothetical protein B0H13DRAFT_2336530 [Mycena leptocephala]|nr:hypothetical protein B0H13DRAFT_2336530 [Mycena leptocephala]